ncbi:MULTISPECIES: type II toxin-antitoxin system CcdA family antitoxin [unclassified Arsukibacterium]|uniref:type II toxin-antitoxin system CcdA family antitoxin n=1 Tax=unclassified Arsukibacterium TaxID=2635278 RepID=UPI000C959672|nr:MULTISPECIES: type II toxin-antitoxin system CcdA family antitoxin [unclassified Arsukibacterium]MAA93218.1 post-segregation antitoxin CcdA [Rheinheimera sp.]HAW92693.1 post-segregation antitoxin CcdA [Candidatus Azambacteria bacterium]|tara:strand:+ start:198 stop:443 length:246 start_codon:yes stop_codon:yes gene_type:complete
MNSVAITAPAKKRTNLSLDNTLLQEAKSLGINLSQSAEIGITEAIKQRKQALWLDNNAEAIDSSNKFVNQHGLPLAQYRTF